MSCARVLSRLHAYADGELPRFRARRIAGHLETCASCRARLADLRELGNLLAEVSAPPVPEGFSTRVLAEAARRPTERQPGRFLEWLPSGFQGVLLGMSVPMRVAACGTAVLAFVVGMSTAGRVTSLTAREPVSAPAQELYGLEWFGSAPPISVAAAYLSQISPNSRGEDR